MMMMKNQISNIEECFKESSLQSFFIGSSQTSRVTEDDPGSAKRRRRDVQRKANRRAAWHSYSRIIERHRIAVDGIRTKSQKSNNSFDRQRSRSPSTQHPIKEWHFCASRIAKEQITVLTRDKTIVWSKVFGNWDWSDAGELDTVDDWECLEHVLVAGLDEALSWRYCIIVLGKYTWRICGSPTTPY